MKYTKKKCAPTISSHEDAPICKNCCALSLFLIHVSLILTGMLPIVVVFWFLSPFSHPVHSSVNSPLSFLSVLSLTLFCPSFRPSLLSHWLVSNPFSLPPSLIFLGFVSRSIGPLVRRSVGNWLLGASDLWRSVLFPHSWRTDGQMNTHFALDGWNRGYKPDLKKKSQLVTAVPNRSLAIGQFQIYRSKNWKASLNLCMEWHSI